MSLFLVSPSRVPSPGGRSPSMITMGPGRTGAHFRRPYLPSVASPAHLLTQTSVAGSAAPATGCSGCLGREHLWSLRTCGVRNVSKD